MSDGWLYTFPIEACRPPTNRDLDERAVLVGLVGCEIAGRHISQPNVVTAIEGPGPPEPDWYARPLMGGYTIEFEDLRDIEINQTSAGRKRRINEVFVVGGAIVTGPTRDVITIGKRVRNVQLSLF